ncbi:MAG TPA: tetratricopeptide repeat protein [Arachidicoccus sp.]
MKKIVFSVLALAGGVSFVSAQSLDDGIKALYYGKFTSATQILQQVVQKDPKNTEAVYWLGQVYLNDTYGETNGVQKAATLYQQTATANPQDAWILVGLGEIDYINKNNTAAEQKFEQAITLSNSFKGKNKEKNQAAILTGIGRASAYGNKDMGDPSYAIPALQKAANLDKTAPEPDLYLGMNFLKLGGDMGGNAYQAYADAKNRDPKYAAAFYHMGLIFHGQDNYEVMDTWYQQGIAADPNYGPIYADYFDYWKAKDANKAKGFLDKYVGVSDNGCDVQYYQADYLFQAGSYQESLAKGKQMESGSCASFSHLPLLMAMDYHRLGDVANATSYAKKFFASTAASNILADDYAYGGYIFKDDSTMADSAVAYLEKAYELDTLPANRTVYSDSISYALDKANKPVEKYKWDRKVYDSKDTGADGYNLAMFNVGYDALQVATTDPKYFPIADSFFVNYKARYPEQIYGYKYLATSKLMQGDTTAAVPYVEDYIGQMSKDTAKYKTDMIDEYGVLANYYVNSKGDYASGLKQFQGILSVDPTNETAKQYAEQIQAYLDKHKGGAAADSTGKKSSK